MKQQLRLIIFLFGSGVYAQVGIGTPAPNNSAQLEIVSPNKGLLIPKLNLTSLTDNSTITNGNVEGLMVYNMNNVPGMAIGFYYWSAGQWNKLINRKDLPISSGPGAPTATVPANAVVGSVYVNELTGEIYAYKTGGVWVLQSSVSSDPGNIIIEGTDNKAFLDAVVAADKLGKDLTSSDGSILGVQNKSVLADMNLQVKVDNTTLEVNPTNGLQVKDSGITIPKIASGGVNKVLVTDATGAVAWINKDAFETVVDMSTIIGLGTIASPLMVNDLGIVTAKLADNAVTTTKILNGTILSEDIASGGVNKVLVTDATGAVAWINKDAFETVVDMSTIIGLGTIASPLMVNDLGIVTAKLADNAVTTTKILNGTILSEDIASGGVNKVLVTDATGAVAWINKDAFETVVDMTTIIGLGTIASPLMVNDLGIVTAKLADNAVTTTKIASGGNDKVLVTDAAGVVAWLDKSAFGAIADQVTIEGLGTTASPFLVKDLGIVTSKLADNAVTTPKIVDGAVTTAKILNETILSEDIKDGTVGTVDIATGGNDKVLVTDATGVVAWLDKSAFGAIADQVTIEGLGTTASPFLVKDLGIVTSKLADNAVTTQKIVDGAVTTAKILNETILSEDIKDGTVGTVDIATGGTDKVLVTDAAGIVAWLDKSAFGAIADQVTIEGLGTTASPFLVKDLGIATAKLADNAVTSTKIASGGNDKVLVTDAAGVVIWLDKSAFGAIADQVTIEGLGTTASPFLVKDLGIVTAKLADNAVTTTKIASGGNDKVLVTDAAGVVAWLDKSAFGAIADQVTIEGLGTTASPFLVKDLGIVTAKLADDAVTTGKILNETILSEDIKDGTVGTVDIATGGNDKVLVTDATGVVAWLDKSAFGAIADQVTIEGLGTTASPFLVKDLGIVTSKLADNAVTTAKIVDGAVTTAKILNETILSEDIKDGTVGTVDIATGGTDKVLVTDATGAVTWLDKSAFGAIADQVTIEGLGTIASPFLVKDLGIVTDKLADSAVTTVKLANDAVTTDKIIDDAVTSAKILNETILSEDILDGEVKTADIADKNVTVDKINNGLANQILRTDALGTGTEWGTLISTATGNLITPGADNGVFIDQAAIKANETVTTISGALPAGNLIGTYTNETPVSVDINETVTTLTGALTDGHDIGTYKNEANADVVLKETITSISQNNTTGVIRYIDEEGVPDEDVNTSESLNVISANPDNAIKVGTDGGAFINSITKVVYSAEYAGGVLMADGSNNIGVLTSNNTGGPDWMNFYEWSSGQATVQDYDVVLRFTVPNDFTAWDITNPIQIMYSADAGTNLSGVVYNSSGAIEATIPVSNSATWTSVTITPATLGAGSTGIIVMKLSSKVSDSNAKIRIGDITLNYKK